MKRRKMFLPVVIVWNPFTVRVIVAVSVTTSAIIAGGAIYWWRKLRRLKKDVVVLERSRVVRHSSCGTQSPSAGLNMIWLMNLHQGNCQLPPYNKCNMISASDYVSALSIPGEFNWPKAARTLLMRMHMPLLLPLTEMMAGKGSAQEDGSQDPLAAIGGTMLINLLFRDAMSPLQLYSMSELAHVVMSQTTQGHHETCMLAFVGHAELPEELQTLPDQIVLDEAAPKLLHGLDPAAPRDVVPDPGGLDWLPDLSFAHVGLPWTTNAYQAKWGQVFALLLNRLSANVLPAAWRPEGSRGRRAAVRLCADGPEIRTPGGLIASLCDAEGSDVFMRIVSRTTGFSKGFAVKQDDEWLQVPFVVPLRTGLTMLEGAAESSGTADIVSLMNHAEVALRVATPGGPSFQIFYYMSIDGTTAWHAGLDAEQPWANSATAEVQHTAWHTAEEYEAAADVAAAVACVINRTADVLRLPSGGYGCAIPQPRPHLSPDAPPLARRPGARSQQRAVPTSFCARILLCPQRTAAAAQARGLLAWPCRAMAYALHAVAAQAAQLG
eukprot:jgi/Ulvmu1/1588/UM111_0016.1